MKKLKFLTLAAIAAATAMVSSCSDNVELSTPTKETGNTNDGALVIKASMGDSRVAETTSTGFTGFTLFGIENPPSGNSSCFLNGVDGITYSGSMTGTWSTSSASVAVWPHTESGYTYNFYGLSAGGSADLSESGVSVIDGNNNSLLLAGTFSYTAPLHKGTVRRWDYDVEDYVNEEVDMPDLSKQKDILFASDLGTSKGNDGIVNLPFKHAFSKVTMDIRYNTTELKVNEDGVTVSPKATTSSIHSGAVLAIDYVALCNVKVNGTFTYNDGGGTWVVNGEKNRLKYVFNEVKTFIAGSSDDEGLDINHLFTIQPLIKDNDALMVIPQDLELWVPGDEDEDDEPKAGTYVELHCAAWNITDATQQTVMPWDSSVDATARKLYKMYITDPDQPKYMTSVYFPLRLNSTSGIASFDVNKQYNLRINFVNSRNLDGSPAIAGVVFN